MMLGAFWKKRRQHRDLLVKAAGISSARLVCHQDTWSFVVGAFSPVELGVTPEPLADTDGHMVAVRLSGPKLARVLEEMTRRTDPGSFLGIELLPKPNRAVRQRIYLAMAEVIGQVDPAAKPGTPVPDIVIDDRLADPPEA